MIAGTTSAGTRAAIPQDGPRDPVPILFGLGAIAVVLRLIALRPMWLDEATTARGAEGAFGSLVSAARVAGAHPPLDAVAVWVATKFTGDGILGLRVVSLLAGVALVPVVYATATEMYDRRAGIAAAVVAAVAPSAVWFSGVAGPTTLAALLAACALWAVIRAVRTNDVVHWLSFALADVALIWTHQLGVLHVAVLHVAVAVVLARCLRSGEAVAPLMWGWIASLAATFIAVASLGLYRGFGPPNALPPLEYATSGAPAGGQSVFDLSRAATASLIGFHPPDVTSRLLALWPLAILLAFLIFGRRWSLRGGLIVALALTPFVAMLIAQLAGAPREPAFAVEWAATALPAIGIGVGRGLSLIGPWPRVRFAAAACAALLLLALADQTNRVNTLPRFNIEPVMAALEQNVAPGDAVIYSPPAISDVVRYNAAGAHVADVRRAGRVPLGTARRVQVISAFALGDKRDADAAMALISELSKTRHLVERHGNNDVRMWVFA